MTCSTYCTRLERWNQCRFQKTTSVVIQRALHHAGIGVRIADRAASMANQGGFRGPGDALDGDSDDLGRATSTLKPDKSHRRAAS